MNKPILIEIIIWCLILTVIFCMGIFGYSKIFIEPNIYNIQFRDIDGITKGSPVRFMGINIGYVKKLIPADKHINVQIIVTQKNMMIPNGTRARVEFYGLGGSKSIELMPDDNKDAQGIVSTSTLRLHDMVMKSENLVETLEMAEKMVKGINKPATQKILENIAEFKDTKIQDTNANIKNYETNIVKKTESIRKKQRDAKEKINNINEMVDKLNEFIKK